MEDIKSIDFLQGQKQNLRIFRQANQQRSDAEAKINSWKQQRLKEIDTEFQKAMHKLDDVQNSDTKFSTRTESALQLVQDELSKLDPTYIKMFDGIKTNKNNKTETEDSIPKVVEKFDNIASLAATDSNKIVEVIHHFHNRHLSELEHNVLNNSTLLLLLSSLCIIFFILGIFMHLAIFIVLGVLLPPLLLACADRVWNLEKKEPGKEFHSGYFWLYLIAPIASVVAFFWLITINSSSTEAINKRHQPQVSKTVLSKTIKSVVTHLIQTVMDADVCHNNLFKLIQQQTKQVKIEHEKNAQEVESEYQKVLSETKSTYEKSWQQIQKQVTFLQQNNGLIGISWENDLWNSWNPPTDKIISPYLRIGTLVENGDKNHLVVPAIIPVIGKGNIVIESYGKAKDEAAQIVRNLMLRLLSFIPPGKLKFILIDPVGLGQNMAAFMNLDDYDETLTGGKIWTETQHIEGQLAKLTEHMEFVIQKYLRDKYLTIEDYNTEAGEVAEPYRLLVAINFPMNFSEAAARRLVSITLNGPRCGVYTILTVDTEQELPYGFRGIAEEQYPVKKRNSIQNIHKMYPAICSACGNECKVPFKPQEGRPVYCKACYEEIKQRGSENIDNEYDESDDDDEY